MEETSLPWLSSTNKVTIASITRDKKGEKKHNRGGRYLHVSIRVHLAAIKSRVITVG